MLRRPSGIRGIILSVAMLAMATFTTSCGHPSEGADAGQPDGSATAADAAEVDAGATDAGEADAGEPDAGDMGAPSADESDTFNRGGGSLATNQESVTLAESLFAFDPTINTSAAPSANASAIGANVQSNLDSCGQVTVSGTMVTADFGAAPGCTLSNGVQISGTVTAVVSQSGSTTTVALTLTDVVVNGKALSGPVSFATSNGSTFDVTSSLTSGSDMETGSLSVVGTAESYTISGTIQATESGTTSTVQFENVVHVLGECYANSGSMTITKGATTETVTFLATTPETGDVTVKIGARSFNMTLPAYGYCPSSTNGRDGGVSAPDGGLGFDGGRADGGVDVDGGLFDHDGGLDVDGGLFDHDGGLDVDGGLFDHDGGLPGRDGG